MPTECPKGWKFARVDAIAEIVGGGTPSRSDASLWGGDIPWATPTDITSLRGRFLDSTASTISRAGLDASAAKLLPAGAVLMTTRATIGACAIARRPVATNQGFQNLVPKPDVHCEFLLYLVQSRGPEMERLAAGSTFLEISKRSVAALEVLVPPLAEQRKIAAILSSVDETIEKSEAVIGQLDVVKKAMLEELLTRGIRTREFEPIAEEWRLGRVLPGIAKRPLGWQLVRLTDVAKLESGHTPSRRHPEYWDGGIPWVSLHDTGALDGPEILETAQTVSDLGIANSSARLLPRGTVVFSRTATVGKATVLGREMSTSQDFANYVCGPRVHNRYLMHLLRFMQTEWARLMAGSTHQTIYMPVFRDLQILLPDVREQERIAEVADAVEARIQAERDSLVPLRAVKASLASEILSGATRVQPAEAT